MSGTLYLEALHMTRVAREAYVLICGKYPHPQTIVPGGMSSTINLTVMNEMFVRLAQFFDYCKKIAAHLGRPDGVLLRRRTPHTSRSARGRANMIDTGIFDHPDAYDATYENADCLGRSAVGHTRRDRRWRAGDHRSAHASTSGSRSSSSTPTTSEWTGSGQRQRFPTDPAGKPLSPYHPWNKVTKPRPQGQSWKEKYTWDTAPRWDRLGMEAGCYARLWNTAVAQKLPDNPFIESTGHSLKCACRKGALPEMELEWHVPKVWNAFERNRARALLRRRSRAMVAMNNWLAAMDRLKNGDTRTSTPFEIPKTGEQVGRRLLGRRPRLPDAPPGARPRRGGQLPDRHAVDVERVADGSLGPARALRRGGASTRRCSRKPTTRSSSAASTCCAPSAASTRACPARRTSIRRRA